MNVIRLLEESFELPDGDGGGDGGGGGAGDAPMPGVGGAMPPPSRWENVHILCDAKEELPESTDHDLNDDDEDWCYLCEIGAFDQTNHWCQMLRNYIAKHGGDMRNRSLCRDVQEMYNLHIRPYLDVPRTWTQGSIARHIQCHTIDPVLIARHQIRVLGKILEVMERGSLRSRRMDRDAPDEIDRQSLKAYRETLDTQRRMLRELERLK